MASISFTAINVRVLGLNQRSSRATTWHLCRVMYRDAQSPVGLRAAQFGGVTTAVIIRNLSTGQTSVSLSRLQPDLDQASQIRLAFCLDQASREDARPRPFQNRES
jgi:hypothetical protein